MSTTIALSDGRTFTFHSDDPAHLASIATSLLHHLRCSFEIRYPVISDEDRADRERDRAGYRQSRRDGADAYQDADLRAAFLAGWDAAPKSVRYLR